MKKNLKKYLFAATAVFAMLAGGSCSKDLTTADHDSAAFNDDGTITVTVGMEMPQMNSVATRTMGETPDYGSLNLYMFVFEENEGLKQYAKVESQFAQNENLVKFKLKLEPTEKNAVMHLIATDQPDFESQIVYGMEDRAIGSLYTDDGHEAYWQRISFGSNIPGAEEAEEHPNEKAKLDAITAKLSRVPMIRNFCRVSITSTASNFSLTGLYVVNTVDRGSVAPYVADSKLFVDYCNGAAAKNYNEISSTGHIGTLPTGVTLINKLGDINSKIESADGATLPNGSAVYIYERPARTTSAERTYVIIRGLLNGHTAESFYKIDLGHVLDDDVVGIFQYYNLLRNFDYAIKLNEVASDGYDSLEEAANGPVFNNFSASVEARNMNSISDGDDMIFVNFTSYVFTLTGQTVDLLAQFREKINDGKGGDVKNNLLDIKWEQGEVISSVTGPQTETKNGEEWNKYVVTAAENGGDKLKQQSVYIFRGKKDDGTYGLYREVIFFSHEPWGFLHMDTFPGLWESIDDMPTWDWSEKNREIGQSKGSPLTLFFELPPGLPQALFPLRFVIESDRQNIQNAYQGNAVVRSVPASESLFKTNPTIGTPTTTRIQYVKTVTWEDYYGENSEELVGTGSSIVRCRFLTITDLAQDGVGGTNSKSTTHLRVYNEYFGDKQVDAQGNVTWNPYHQDGFERDVATSDPSPRFWDFNSGIWDDILSQMASRYEGNNPSYSPIFDATNNSTDELIFVDGTETVRVNVWTTAIRPTLKTGTDENGVRYVQTTNAGDILKHKHTYSQTERTIRVEVVSTNANGQPAQPQVKISNITGAQSLNVTYVQKDSDEANGFYVYEVTVPSVVTALDVDIMAPTGSPNMRFYKINFYPRWDELAPKEN